MKLIKNLLFLTFSLACFAGCGTMATVPYSFTENNGKTAEITFETNLNKSGGAKGIMWGGKSKKSIQLISIEDNEIPLPERGTVWNPVLLPADKPLILIVNIFYYYEPDKPDYSDKKRSTYSTGTLLDIILTPALIIDDIISVGNTIIYLITTPGWRNMDIIFNCPPLEAGKNYRLEYRGNWLVKRRLVLRDTSTKKIIYEQEVKENWNVGGKGNWQGEEENWQSNRRIYED
jgi:hypothetical protein